MNADNRISTKAYLDALQEYMPAVEVLLGMAVERPEPRQLRVTDGVTSCTILFRAYIDKTEDLRPTLMRAADTVKAQTQRLQEKYAN